MAKKLRVYQLARELNLDNSEVIRELQHMGVPVTSHSNTVEDRLADHLRKRLRTEAVEVAAPPVEEDCREGTAAGSSLKPAPIPIPKRRAEPKEATAATSAASAERRRSKPNQSKRSRTEGAPKPAPRSAAGAVAATATGSASARQLQK